MFWEERCGLFFFWLWFYNLGFKFQYVMLAADESWYFVGEKSLFECFWPLMVEVGYVFPKGAC